MDHAQCENFTRLLLSEAVNSRNAEKIRVACEAAKAAGLDFTDISDATCVLRLLRLGKIEEVPADVFETKDQHPP